MQIYCPKCHWEPPADARWRCSCGHAWNTFDTQGRCPHCGKVWRDTQCLACHAWSKHHDWYHDLPPVDVDEITEPAQVPAEEGRWGSLRSPDDRRQTVDDRPSFAHRRSPIVPEHEAFLQAIR